MQLRKRCQTKFNWIPTEVAYNQ